MFSPPRNREREEERRLSLRTLAIASIASATAAIVTSQFWTGGTPLAAAITPVIVALVREMLHRPTEAIARRVTSERTAIPSQPPEAPPPRPEPRTDKPRPDPGSEAPVRIYGQPQRRRRKIAVGVVATTAVLAFAIAAFALTVPELITGRSIVKSDRHTTLIPTKKKSKQEQETTPTTPSEQTTETTPQKQQRQSTTPTQTETETTPTETETTPKSQPK